MTYNKSIYIFHRSLRLDDNIGLMTALKNSIEVIPIFIFTPEQITHENKYRSLFAIKFMIDALIDLNHHLNKFGSKLYIFYGEQHLVLNDILNSDFDIDAVFINKDYTPYAIDRETKLQTITEKVYHTIHSCEDYLLHDINSIRTKNDKYYSVFTPFYVEAIKHVVKRPKVLKYKNFIKKSYTVFDETTFDDIKNICSYDSVNLYEYIATREEALKRLKNIKNHKNYENDRNTLSLETTKLSAYIKFGLVSIREVYHRVKSLFGKEHTLIKQLYWREFYYNLTYNRLDMLEESTSFRVSYDKIKWKYSAESKKLLKKWKNGQTGYPIVDAGMRELNMTGYMHNRTRLITSNFLVKHLFIDWREGEKYFASKLIDYDPSVNNGNWQFTSGSGADSQPFFRMMNPWLQQIKHDNNCEYIKTWIPELIDVPDEDIHSWQDTYQQYQNDGIKYPEPCKIYDYNKLKKESKQIYSNAFK